MPSAPLNARRRSTVASRHAANARDWGPRRVRLPPALSPRVLRTSRASLASRRASVSAARSLAISSSWYRADASAAVAAMSASVAVASSAATARRSRAVSSFCSVAYLLRVVQRRSSKASVDVERHRGRGLKARCGRRESPGKVLKERRSPRERGRMGTSARTTNAPDRGFHRVRRRLDLRRRAVARLPLARLRGSRRGVARLERGAQLGEFCRRGG